MQNAERFPFSPATVWVSKIAYLLVEGSFGELRTLVRAQNWYHSELWDLQNGQLAEVRGYPFDGHRQSTRLLLAVGLMHLVAVSPLSVLGGMLAMVLLPIMALFLSFWRLAQFWMG